MNMEQAMNATEAPKNPQEKRAEARGADASMREGANESAVEAKEREKERLRAEIKKIGEDMTKNNATINTFSAEIKKMEGLGLPLTGESYDQKRKAIKQAERGNEILRGIFDETSDRLRSLDKETIQ